jgi:hypothetical protein
MTYFILTASLIKNGKEQKREEQYRQAFAALKASLAKFQGIQAKILIVENNGKRQTFLDELGADAVIYTNSNLANEPNKGVKELKDIQAAIQQQGIQPDDFIVKMTGRYSVKDGSEFMKAVAERAQSTDAIVRYGSFTNETAPATKVADVITGLIGIRAKYIPAIQSDGIGGSPIEWQWGKVITQIPDERVVALNRLGVEMPIADGPPILRGGSRRRRRSRPRERAPQPAA